MNRHIISPAAAAVLVASFAPWALAAGNHAAMSSNMSSSHITQIEPGAPPKTDIRPFQSARLSLTDAIRAARQQQKAEQQQGGRAIMAKVQIDSNGKPNFDVDVVKNGQLQIAQVDASSGKVG